jgi:hypothetical protein
MKRGLVLSLCAVTLAACCVGRAVAQAPAATLSLDVFYANGNTNAGGGSWQLLLKGSSQGLAGLTASLSGVTVGSEVFRAPQPAFKITYDAKAWNTNTDNNAATVDMLFGQIPLAAPGPQDLVYGVGVTTVNPDELGVSVDITGTNMGSAVLLAHGSFAAGQTPAVSGAIANIFTVQGTATNPPAANTILLAALTSQTRNNAATNPGDANLDKDVDVFQFNGGGDAQILSANLGLTGTALWQQGDFNGDKDVDVFQFNGGGDAQILSANLGTVADQPAGKAHAKYDPVTGNLWLDLGTNIAVAGFESVGGKFKAAEQALLGATVPAQKDASILAYFSATGLPVGDFNLGAVLPKGLGAADINFSYTPVGQDSVVAAVEILVPEPATFAMVGLGLMGFVAMRRNRQAA